MLVLPAHWDISLVHTFPPIIVVTTKTHGEAAWDEIRILWKRSTKRIEMTGKRVMRNSDSPDDLMTQATPFPLREHRDIVDYLNRVLDKVHYHILGPQDVPAIGHMNYDPVEGEPDYDERYHKPRQVSRATGSDAGHGGG